VSAAATSAAQGEPAPQGRSFHLRYWLARLLCAPAPPFVLVRWRLLALRACGVRVGRGTNFWGLPDLQGPGAFGPRLRIGIGCGFNLGCFFELAAPVTIGERVSVGHQVRFLTSQWGIPSGTNAGRVGPITVGDGAWLGARCTVLAGVTVGAGAVVGAGVTVAKDIPAQTLVTGAQSVSLARWR
jgi:acetyltransferase-like isoleucine patch superfamily enzyme